MLFSLLFKQRTSITLHLFCSVISLFLLSKMGCTSHKITRSILLYVIFHTLLMGYLDSNAVDRGFYSISLLLHLQIVIRQLGCSPPFKKYCLRHLTATHNRIFIYVDIVLIQNFQIRIYIFQTIDSQMKIHFMKPFSLNLFFQFICLQIKPYEVVYKHSFINLVQCVLTHS